MMDLGYEEQSALKRLVQREVKAEGGGDVSSFGCLGTVVFGVGIAGLGWYLIFLIWYLICDVAGMKGLGGKEYLWDVVKRMME